VSGWRDGGWTTGTGWRASLRTAFPRWHRQRKIPLEQRQCRLRALAGVDSSRFWRSV